MAQTEDRNTRVTREFRENGGKVGGSFANATIIILHTKGAKTGRDHVIPLVALPLEGGSYAIFGSHGGSPRHPDWYRNLRAHPEVTYEVGTRVVRARARVTKGEERERIWTRQKENRPYFGDYERKTTRVIPVIVLETMS